MGYREYAKDYEIEYVEQPGKRRPKALRIYVGPYFRFQASKETIGRRKRQYLLLQLLLGLALLVPMMVDCSLTRTWYVEVPSVSAFIPWLLAACALWRLWTAGELVTREHCDLLHDRMRGASFFLMGLTGISVVGSIVALTRMAAAAGDYLAAACFLASLGCSVAMFAMCRDLQMEPVENPEKPRARKNGEK